VCAHVLSSARDKRGASLPCSEPPAAVYSTPTATPEELTQLPSKFTHSSTFASRSRTPSTPPPTRADFPDGFVFGVATSAYQVPTPSSRPPHPHRTPLLAGARLLDRSCTRCSASLLGIAVLTSEIVIVFHCLGSVVTAAVSSSVIAAGLSLLHFLISVTTHKSPVWINSVSFGPPGLV
jgi:hypothetical protein